VDDAADLLREPASRRVDRHPTLQLVVRSVLLAVLVAWAVGAIAWTFPAPRSQADLSADLAAGRVAYLRLSQDGGEVRWVDGTWLRWRSAGITDWPASNGTQPSPDASLVTGVARWLDEQAARSPHPVVVTRAGPAQDDYRAAVVWPPLGTAATGATVVAFLMMLSAPRRRYANRWAWFWLWVILPFGDLLYLTLEPQPLWHRRVDDLPPAGPVMRGGRGFVTAFALAFAAGIAAALVSIVLDHVRRG